MLRPGLKNAIKASLSRLVPLALGVIALMALEQGGGEPSAEARPVQSVPAGRKLILLWVDSLALADMDPASPHMTRLKARLPEALHGPARACADAVSVPCFTAMATGVDQFSLFAIARNFGGVGRLPAGNLFAELQTQGRRVGFIGDTMARKAVEGFDWVEIPDKLDDAYTVRRALEAFEQEQLDVVVVHIREADVTSHTDGPASEAYAAALEQADHLIDEILAKQAGELHVAVFGDHGHTEDGRHFAGLDVPTYAAFFGPIFARRATMAMHLTDYGVLWSRVFGIERPTSDRVAAYFAGDPLPQADQLPAPPGRQSAPAIPVIIMVVVFAIAIAAPWAWRQDLQALRGLALTAAALGALMLILGLEWTALRTQISSLHRWTNVGLGLTWTLGAAALLWPLWRRWGDRLTGRLTGQAALALLTTGALLMSLPTIYKYGGPANGLTAIIVAMLVGAWLGQSRRVFVMSALAVAVAWTVWNPAVRNFKLLWFPMFTEDLAAVIVPTVIGLVVIALWAARGPLMGQQAPARTRAFLLAGGVGLMLALVGPYLPPRVWMVPCVATPIAAWVAWCNPARMPLLIAMALPAYAFLLHHDPQRLAPVAAVIALWPLWARARACRASTLEVSASVLLLSTATLWALFGARISGIDFTYFFRWLPAGTAFKETWMENAALTLSLYGTLPGVGLLLARRVAPESIEGAIAGARQLARARMALCLMFILGFTIAGGAGPFISSDVLQSAALWGTVLVALMLIPDRIGAEVSEDAAPSVSEPLLEPAHADSASELLEQPAFAFERDEVRS